MVERVRDDRGAVVSVWAVLGLALTVLIIGIAVDLSGQINAKRQANDVADQAARSAAQQVNTQSYLDDGRSVAVVAGRAKTAAVTYVQRYGMVGSAHIEARNRLVVETAATYRPVFLSMFGIGNLRVTGTATVQLVRALEGRQVP